MSENYAEKFTTKFFIKANGMNNILINQQSGQARYVEQYTYARYMYVCASTLNTYLLKIYGRKYYENEMNKFHFLSHSWQFANYFR